MAVDGAGAMSVAQPGSLTRFWLWAVVGVIAMFGSFSYGAGPLAWPFIAMGAGLLAAHAVTARRAALTVAACIATIPMMVVADDAWPLVAGPLAALALALVHTRRDAATLALAAALGAAALLALNTQDPALPVVLAPVLVVLAALAAGRLQREAAGAITGAGLALFAFGYPAAGIPLTLAGAALVLALGLRRRRLAVTSS